MKGLKDNTAKSAWVWFFNSLVNTYPANELKSIRRILFEHLFNISEKDIIMEKNIRLTETDIVKIIKAIKKLENQVPIQYITGIAYFLEFVFDVDQDVLIPRPETEELVLLTIDKANQYFASNKNIRILDIGTGSGCIAIVLANKIQSADVTAIDKSKKAINIASKNSKKYYDKVNFLELDIFDNPGKIGEYNIVVSNPPYVLESEKAIMQRSVLDYEPESALFVSDDSPLVFYEEIIKQSSAGLLKNEGILLFEINEKFGNEVSELMEKYGFKNVEIHKDFHNKTRFVFGQLNY